MCFTVKKKGREAVETQTYAEGLEILQNLGLVRRPELFHRLKAYFDIFLT